MNIENKQEQELHIEDSEDKLRLLQITDKL